MEQKPDFAEVLDVASEAGHILLENGAEISRVEDIMNRISTHFGVNSGNALQRCFHQWKGGEGA